MSSSSLNASPVAVLVSVRVDPVSGAQPLRSGLCEIERISSSG